MKRRTIFVSTGALAILGVAFAAWWFYTGTPEYSLAQLAAAAAAHQRLGVEEYVDVHAVATSIVDDLVQKQMTTAMQSPDDNPFAGIGTTLGMSMVQNMKPVLTARLEEAFWAMAGDDAARQAPGGNTALRALGMLKATSHGVVASERRGPRARVSLEFRRPAPDTSATVVTLRLDRSDHHWRVTSVEGLAEVLDAAGGGSMGWTPLQRAYIASMKSDLRNLVTAEEAFFADSVRYSGSVSCSRPYRAEAAMFCPTTGNQLTGPTLSRQGQGWSGTMTNANLPGVTCAIFINTAAVPPATVEGSPACK